MMNPIKLLSLSLALCATTVAFGTARVQVIHNSADAAAATVDVWLNDQLLLDDFTFRSASPFIDAPSGVNLVVSICPPTSTDTTSAIAQFNYTLAANETYVLVANGIVSPAGYMPATPFDIYVNAMGRESSANGMMETDVMVFHGSTDAPIVDIHEESAGELVGDVPYGAFSSYLELPTADYIVQVRDEFNSKILAAYSAPLQTLSLGGGAAVVLASGFLDPTMNSNGADFGLFVALPSGGPLVALPAAPIPTAQVQVIHNSADAAAATVDVWLNDAPLIDDFAFRTASPYVTAQAGVPFDVSIALPTSTDTIGALAKFTYTLAAGDAYVLVANGIVSPSGYMPATPFDIYVQGGARTAATIATNTDLLVFHGSTDAPTVDVDEVDVLNTTLVPSISYGEFQGYVEAPTDDYTLSIVAGGQTVASYQAPLAALGLQGASLTVVASGFLDPTMNSNGAGFGLWAATAAGGALVELPVATSTNDIDGLGVLNLWPNPSEGAFNLQLDATQDMNVSLNVIDGLGRQVFTSALQALSVGQNVLELDLSAQPVGNYTVIVQNENGVTHIPLQLLK